MSKAKGKRAPFPHYQAKRKRAVLQLFWSVERMKKEEGRGDRFSSL